MDSSDSEDCQLYTRTAENLRKQKKLLKLKLTSQDEDIKVGNSPPQCISSDTDDDVPLSRRVNCKKARKLKNKENPLNKPGNCNEPTIVIDDDNDFNSLRPINFDGEYTSRSANLDQESGGEVESDNNDIKFTVEWNCGYNYSHHVFKLKQSDKLGIIFESLAQKVGVPSNRVSLMHDFNSVNPNNTVSSLNLRFYCGLTGSVSPRAINYDDLGVNSSNIKCEDKIAVKLQLDSKKHIILKIIKSQKAKELFMKCAEELNCEERHLKITFDGESVKPDDIISELDIDDGDILNVYVKN